MTKEGNAEQRAEFDRTIGLTETAPINLDAEDDHPALRGQPVPDYYRKAGTNMSAFHASLGPG